jgi:hypothetical protein
VPTDAEAITLGIRSQGGARVQMRELDVLAIRVGDEGGNGKPAQVPLRLLAGAQTEGEFGACNTCCFNRTCLLNSICSRSCRNRSSIVPA